MTVIAPNSMKDAAERNLPALQANLTNGSAWMERIIETDDPSRGNSPYYGPATQFLVDCFFDIASTNPDLINSNRTPLERYRAADYVIHHYIGNFAVGKNGILASAYEATDISDTQVHANRRWHLTHNRDHVLLGASVPFDDVARLSGGAAIKLDRINHPQADIPGILTRSSGLQIVAGVQGDRTPILTDAMGYNYFDPKYFVIEADGSVSFSQKALSIIRSVLSPVGCPSAHVVNTEGTGNVFQLYWSKIIDYLVADTDYSLIRRELSAQNDKSKPTLLVGSTVTPMGRIVTAQTAPPPRPPKKKSPKASKRYTPPKR